MSNLLLILKTSTINNTGINKILKDSSLKYRYKTLSLLLIPIVAMIVLGYAAFEMLIPIADMLEAYNQLELLLYLSIGGAVLSSVFTTIYKAPGYLISSKDYELLMSLPISQSTILASKLIYLVAINYLVSAFLVIPPTVIYFMKAKPSFLFVIYSIIMFLFMSLIPVVVASIVVFIIGKMSSKVKYKNIFLIVGSLLILVLYVIISYNLQDIAMNIVQNSANIGEGIRKIYFPAYYFVDALVNNNFISLMKFILVSIIPFMIFVFIFSKGFRSINANMAESYKNGDYKMESLKESSVVDALLKKEIKRYFSSYVYLLNTSIGMIFMTIFAVGALLFGGEQISAMMNIPYGKESIFRYVLVVSCLFCVMSCTTNCSISLEGKNLWILKSSPIDYMDIFKSKIALNLLVILPLLFINSIIIYIAFGLTISELLIVLIIASLYSIFISLCGLVVNLNFPKLEWTSEVVVVKQSIATLISIGIGFLSIAIPIGIYCLLKLVNIDGLLVSVGIGITICNIVLYKMLKNKGKVLFNNL